MKKEILANEPRLAEVGRGVLARARPLLGGDELETSVFAKEMRALFGFDRLPDPVSGWIARTSSGELVLRRTLDVGKIELRRWEGTLELFRRPPSGVIPALEKLLERRLGEPLRAEAFAGDARSPEADLEVVELELGGVFERLLALREGRRVLLRFVPRLHGPQHVTAHEAADSILMEKTRSRRRPPLPTAAPAPLKLPPGGRFPKRLPPRKKRPGDVGRSPARGGPR